jgi:TetR/AcrR family tetracycline transcriptional repressor
MTVGTPRAPVTRARLLQAALDVVDAEGLEALTMRRLGRELGVEAMSLYHHVPNKGALLDALVGAVIAEIELPPVDAWEWDEALVAAGHAMREALLRHPGVVPVMATRPAFGHEEGLDLIEWLLTVAQRSGLGAIDTMYATRCLGIFVIGAVLAEVDADETREERVARAHESFSALDPWRYPVQTALRDQAMAQGSPWDERALFDLGVRALVDGLRTRVPPTGAPRTGRRRPVRPKNGG